jgi:hypothetical protein
LTKLNTDIFHFVWYNDDYYCKVNKNFCMIYDKYYIDAVVESIDLEISVTEVVIIIFGILNCCMDRTDKTG